jgi:hypothetical protein
MGLSFLVPAFLVGLAALAIPVLIHLTRRQSRESIEFPSLMFIQRVPHKLTSRRKIRNWPLFLMRCLAIALITMAFARPFVQRKSASATPTLGGSKELVILLDRSYSMGYGDRWERAKRAAAQAIDALGPNDRGSLLLFDTRTEAAVVSKPDRALLNAAVGQATPSARATRYAPAFRQAERILAASPHPRREVVLISDFQRNAWESDAGEASSIRLPAGTVVTPVEIASARPENVILSSVTFQRTTAAGRERAAATARLVNQGDRRRPALPVTLEIDGRAVETRSVSLEPGGSATVEFAPVTLAAQGLTRGLVRIPRDSLAADDQFNFALSPDQRIGVLVVNGPGGDRASYFLESALSIGDSPGFRTIVRSAGEVKAADLVGTSVILLNQAALPTGEMGKRVRDLVQNGGGLVLMLGDNRTGGWEGVLPDRVVGAVDHTDDGGMGLGYVDFGHPAFEPFSTPRSGDFTAARFYRYRSLSPTPAQRVLARFGDGGAALTEQRVGSGRVLVWTSAVDADWNDLALQPVFLPFVHQLAKYASGYAPAKPAFTVGEPYDPTVAAASTREYALALTPSGERIEVKPNVPLTLDEPGFYELRDARSGARATAVAVNVDPAESSFDAVAPKEVVAALTPKAGANQPAGGPPTLTLQEREREQSAWWYLVVAGFVLLALETVISNRRKMRMA